MGYNPEIILLKINEIIPYDNNPRKNDDAVDKVAESIKSFGFKSPIILDKDHVIICGHTRYEAAKLLKLKQVPCVIASDLTKKQAKAYRLADNKTAEFALWDMDLLEMELDDLSMDFNMELYGFETSETKYEDEGYSDETQRKVENILNLGTAQFEGVGKYDIPEILPVHDLPEIKEWIGFNYVLSDDDPEGKAVHFFIDDYQFERLWNNPDKYIEKLRQYVCVASPDFSPYADMPLATQIFNHYRKHWVARYLQENGVTVIPTIRASSDKRSLDFFLDGEPKNSIIMISTMWTKEKRSKEQAEHDLEEAKLIVDTLNPSKIFAYGNKHDAEMDELCGEKMEYISTFTSKWGNKDVEK